MQVPQSDEPLATSLQCKYQLPFLKMKKTPTNTPLPKAIRRVTGAATETKGFPLFRSLLRATLTALGHHPAAAEATLEQLLNHWRRVGITADQVADLRARNLAMPRRGLRPTR